MLAEYIQIDGTLIYDPYRPNFKKMHKTKTLILKLKNDNLTEYYKWHLQKKYGTWFDLQKPMWGYHVTIVSGNEKIVEETNWKKYQNKKLSIKYSINLEKHWKFWVLPVYSDNFKKIRAELGLNPDYKFHLTIGREY